jgi:uncharacterized membrane protein
MRCGHVLAAIFWMGRLCFFLNLKGGSGEGSSGSWVELGDGFYLLEKKQIGPGLSPKPGRLRRDILLTWLSGVCLLVLVYYLNINAHTTDWVKNMFPGAGTVFGVSAIIVSWFIYDGIWWKLGLSNPKLAMALTLAVVSCVAYGFCQIFVGPAAYIHLGSMLGTWMIANAWTRGVPVRRQMVLAAQTGGKVDETLVQSTRLRSIHNTYFSFPVLLMMLSGHIPAAYTAHFSWAILIAFFLLGLSVCHLLSKKDQRDVLAAAGATVALATIAIALAVNRELPRENTASTQVSFKEAESIINQRCVACHSFHPTIEQVGASSVPFDKPEQIRLFAERIKVRTVIDKTMPPNNQTGITDEEREKLKRWIDQGALLGD